MRSSKSILLLASIVVIALSDQQSQSAIPAIHTRAIASLDERLVSVTSLYDRGRYRESAEKATELIGSKTLDQASLGYAYCFRGNAMIVLNEYSRAVSDFQTGLKINPGVEGKAELYGMMATSLTNLGKYEEALKRISQSLTFERSGMAYYLRGMLYSRMKDYGCAIQDLDCALQFPDCPSDTRTLRNKCASVLRRTMAKKPIARMRKCGKPLSKFRAHHADTHKRRVGKQAAKCKPLNPPVHHGQATGTGSNAIQFRCNRSVAWRTSNGNDGWSFNSYLCSIFE